MGQFSWPSPGLAHGPMIWLLHNSLWLLAPSTLCLNLRISFSTRTPPTTLMICLKGALLKVQEVLTKAKTIVTDFQDKVNLVIQAAKDLKEQIEEAAGDQDALDFIMGKIQAEIEKLVLELIDRLFKEITTVVRDIITKIDQFLDDKFFPFKEKVFQWLDDVIVATIDSTLEILQKILNLLNRIEEGRWDDLVDHVMDIAKGKLADAFADLRQMIKDKIKSVGK